MNFRGQSRLYFATCLVRLYQSGTESMAMRGLGGTKCRQFLNFNAGQCTAAGGSDVSFLKPVCLTNVIWPPRKHARSLEHAPLVEVPFVTTPIMLQYQDGCSEERRLSERWIGAKTTGLLSIRHAQSGAAWQLCIDVISTRNDLIIHGYVTTVVAFHVCQTEATMTTRC